jgi:hypothetical protein
LSHFSDFHHPLQIIDTVLIPIGFACPGGDAPASASTLTSSSFTAFLSGAVIASTVVF